METFYNLTSVSQKGQQPLSQSFKRTNAVIGGNERVGISRRNDSLILCQHILNSDSIHNFSFPWSAAYLFSVGRRGS